MTRLLLAASNNQAASTTKTYTMYAPLGFQIVSAGFESVADGGHIILASHPVFPGKTLVLGSGATNNIASWGYADGSTPEPNPVEGWVWKVKNTTEDAQGFYMTLLVEEGTGVFVGDATYSWPVTVS